MEAFLLGLPEMAIRKTLSLKPLVFEVAWTGMPACPHCGSTNLRTKDSFWRNIKSIRIHDRASTLRIHCHKYCCHACRRYFNTRLPGVKRWNRGTEVLKQTVFTVSNKGVCNQDIAKDYGISVATVERYYHKMILHKDGHIQNRMCPRVLGIDEHRFTKKRGFATTFCDLTKRRVFDIATGRDVSKLHEFLCTLQGRNRVRVVCIDMNSSYRNIIRQYFPNALVVSDRFHVIRLVNHHFGNVCKQIDEEKLAHGRKRLLRLMLMRPEKLNPHQKETLDAYFEKQPALKAVYDFCHELNELLRKRRQNRRQCQPWVAPNCLNG